MKRARERIIECAERIDGRAVRMIFPAARESAAREQIARDLLRLIERDRERRLEALRYGENV